METPKGFLAIRIDKPLLERFKKKLEREGKQQTTVATRLIEGWLGGKFKV